jgi:hypothetical protein
MAKRIEILAVESGVRAVAELYEKQAPQTCALLWGCLEKPMETEGIQAMWVGRELMLIMPPANQKGDPTNLPEENQTMYPLPGDLVFKYFPAGVTRQYMDNFRDKPVWDFMIMYGKDLIMGGAGNVWAHIVEGLDDLARDVRTIREEGTKTYRVRRLEA